MTIDLDENQRQMTVLALAHLALERPGWDRALREIAAKLDNPGLGMYEAFKTFGASEGNKHAPPFCEPLPRSLSDQEQKVYDEMKAEFDASGVCDPHLAVGLWGPTSGPAHGCIVCGKPVA